MTSSDVDLLLMKLDELRELVFVLTKTEIYEENNRHGKAILNEIASLEHILNLHGEDAERRE